MLTIREIEYISAIYQEKSIARAAKTLYVSQPALTMQLKKIEEKIMFQIFIKNRNNIIPTTLGLELIDICSNILDQMKKIELINYNSMVIKIAIIPTVAPYLLSKVVPKIDTKEWKVNFYEYKTLQILDLLSKNALHFGIIAKYPDIDTFLYNNKHIKYRKLYSEELLFISYIKEEISLKDAMENNQIILLTDGNCLNASIKEICNFASHNSNKYDFSATSIEVVKAMVESKNGCGIIPKFCLNENDYKKFNICNIDKNPAREIGLLYQATDKLESSKIFECFF